MGSLKIHVWAGISKQGATGIVMFLCNLTVTKYADILSASLIPFIQTAYTVVGIDSIKTMTQSILSGIFSTFWRSMISLVGRALLRAWISIQLRKLGAA